MPHLWVPCIDSEGRLQWLHDNKEVPCHINKGLNMVNLTEEKKKYFILFLLLVIISVQLSIIHQQKISFTMIVLNFTEMECLNFFIQFSLRHKCNDDHLIIEHCIIIRTTSLTTMGGGQSKAYIVLQEYNSYDRVKDAVQSHFVLPLNRFT